MAQAERAGLVQTALYWNLASAQAEWARLVEWQTALHWNPASAQADRAGPMQWQTTSH